MSPIMANLQQRQWLAQLLSQELGIDLERCPDPEALAIFQQTGLLAVESAIATWGGALLADEVGLGKTHVAMSLIAARQLSLVLVPASLLPMWHRRLEAAGLNGRVLLKSHASVAQGKVYPASQYELIVVDEAHAFIRPETRRHRALAQLALESPVVLLSATPFGIGASDLLHLLRIFIPHGAMRPILGIELETWLEQAQSDWPFFLRRVVVRRSRAFLKRHWPAGLSIQHGQGETLLTFPKCEPVQLSYTPASGAELGALVRGIESLSGERLGMPSGFLRTMLLLRLESSTAAFERSLGRLEGFLRRQLEASRSGKRLSRQSWRKLFGGVMADHDRQQVFPFVYEAERCHRGQRAPSPVSVDDELANVTRLRALVSPLARVDAKVSALLRYLTSGVIAGGGAILVFTRFVDTAEMLFRDIIQALPSVGVGLIHGQAARRSGGLDVGRGELLDAFLSPSCDHRKKVQLLIATDLLSEGIDVQSCGCVVSYDLPWNPRRLLQRFGRLDRLGVEERKIQVVMMTPTAALESLLGLMSRLSERLKDASRLLREPLSRRLIDDDAEFLSATELERLELNAYHRGMDVEHQLLSDLLLLMEQSGNGQMSNSPLAAGWEMRAAPRSPAGTLTICDVGIERAPLRWLFVPASSHAPLSHQRVELYPMLRGILRRTATSAEHPPPRALRIALTDALQYQDKLRNAARQPSVRSPSSAIARLLRELSAHPPPRLSESEALLVQEKLQALLSAPLPSGLNPIIAEHLGQGLSPGGWLSLITRHLPAGVTDNSGVNSGEIRLLGFVIFR